MSFKTEMQGVALELIDNVFGFDGEVSKVVSIMHPQNNILDELTDSIVMGVPLICETFGILGPWEKKAESTQSGDAFATGSPAVRTNDMKLKVAYLNLTFIPTADVDTVLLENGDVYLIIYTKTDPADAVMTMRLRRLKGA